MMRRTLETCTMTLTFEARGFPVFIRLGRFEFYAQRETVKPLQLISRPGPGEIIIDLPGVALMFTKHSL